MLFAVTTGLYDGKEYLWPCKFFATMKAKLKKKIKWATYICQFCFLLSGKDPENCNGWAHGILSFPFSKETKMENIDLITEYITCNIASLMYL